MNNGKNEGGPFVDTVAIGRRVLKAEAEALNAMAESIDESFKTAVELLYAAKGRVICTGMGKSGHVARKIASTFASTGTPAVFVHPAEASHGDLGMISLQDVILALSKSGQAKELGDILAYSARFDIPLIAITADAQSPLARRAQLILLLGDSPEATGELSAPTTSTTLQIALGDALAVALLERRGFTSSDFYQFHPGGTLGAQLRTVGDLMHRDIPLVSQHAPMLDTVFTMTRGRFGCVGVQSENGNLLGIITDGDLRRNADNLLGRTPASIMTRDPLTVDESALAATALKQMTDKQITALFVVKEKLPIGILHIHDLLRAGI